MSDTSKRLEQERWLKNRWKGLAQQYERICNQQANAINFEMTCLNCADRLELALSETERRESAEKAIEGALEWLEDGDVKATVYLLEQHWKRRVEGPQKPDYPPEEESGVSPNEDGSR